MRCARLTNTLLFLAATLVLASRPAAAAGPEFNYLLHCGGCHLEDGSGMPPGIPDLRIDMGYLASFDEGRSYLVRVPGIVHAPMTDAQISDVMNWMLRTYVGHLVDLEAYTEEEVARYRHKVLLDPLALRKRLLEKVQRD